MEEIKQTLNQKIAAAKQHLAEEFKGIRSGRANAALLDKVLVNVYGQKVAISSLATIAVPESRQLLVQPWDKANVGAVEKAITEANLGVGTVNEGDKVRVTIPPLSNERREELVKLVQRTAEEARVGIRNLRREAIDGMEKQANQGGVSDDDKDRFKKDYQTIIDEAIAGIDNMAETKAIELRTV